ncbi:MAG: hypothetical protein WCT53_00585 [Candidatus Gracilibacteria bacterium]
MREAQGTISLTDQKTAPKTLTELKHRIEVEQNGKLTDQDGELLPLPIVLPVGDGQRSLAREMLSKLAIQEIGNLPEAQREGVVAGTILRFKLAIQRLLRLQDDDFDKALVDPQVGVVNMLISRVALMPRYHKLMSAKDILASFEQLVRMVSAEESGEGQRCSLENVPWSRLDTEVSDGKPAPKNRKEILERRLQETGGQLFATLNAKLIEGTLKSKPYARAHLVALEANYKEACAFSNITNQAQIDINYHALLITACEVIMSEQFSATAVREMLNEVCNQLMRVSNITELNTLINNFRAITETSEEDRTKTAKIDSPKQPNS